MTTPELPPLPIVAWMDDGQQAINGSDGTTAFRVITDATKQGMPRAASEPYKDALVRREDALAYADAIRSMAAQKGTA